MPIAVVDRYAWLQAINSEHGPKSHTERTVLTIIYCYTSAKRSSAWPGEELIAKRALISSRQVRRLLTKLSQEGWVRISKRGRFNVYALSIPDAYTSAIGRPQQTTSPDIEASAEEPSHKTSDTGHLAHDTGHFRNDTGHFDSPHRTSGCPPNPSRNPPIKNPLIGIGGEDGEKVRAERTGRALSRQQRLDHAIKALNGGLDYEFVHKQYDLCPDDVQQELRRLESIGHERIAV